MPVAAARFEGPASAVLMTTYAKFLDLDHAPAYTTLATALPFPGATFMDRRNWLAQVSLAGGMSLPLLSTGSSAFGQVAAPQPASATPRKLEPLKITDIKTILTAPAGIRLVVVKVMTSEPGLYGL
jgi:hypothetical protein